MRQIVPLLLSLVAAVPQPVAGQMIPYDFAAVDFSPDETHGERLVEAARLRQRPTRFDDMEIAPQRRQAPRFAEAYGPFRVIDETRAAMRGVTDARTPAQFGAMLRDHPQIATLEMEDCPGTDDDHANLRLGRMIHAHGIATHVPEDGWVASGAVELFLAGARRSAEPSARFAVHSWEDFDGHGPGDFSPNAPQNRAYLDYYRAIGMSDGEARAFYAMTNSTPFSRPRYLSADELARWARVDIPSRWPDRWASQSRRG
jgi:hypothetical protein